MAETATAPVTPAAPAPPAAPPPRFAGKYADVNALEGGIRSAVETLGLPALPEGPLVGTHFKDAATAEAHYLSYQSLLGKVGGKGNAPSSPTIETPTTADKPIPTPGPALNGVSVPEDLDVPQLIGKAGLNINDLSKKWAEKGQLDDADYAAISKVHPAYGRKMVDEIGRGIQARTTQVLTGFIQMAGSAGQYEAAIEWAKNTLSPEAKTAFNNAVSDAAITSNPSAATAAFKSLMFDYMRANPAQGGFGRETAKPSMAEGGAVPSPSGQPFNTVAEYDAATTRQRRGSASQSDIARINATTSQMLERLPLR